MSDNWITLVPREVGFVPTDLNQLAGLALFRSIVPDAEEIEVINSPTLRFFDCGENLEIIRCPHCSGEIDLEWWGAVMDADHAHGGGFQLRLHELPCCRREESFDKLIYDWPQAFGRFAMDAMNSNVKALTPDHIASLEQALDCELVVVYQWI